MGKISIHLVCPIREQLLQDLKNSMSQHMENQVKELKEECLEFFEKQSWSYDQVLKHFDDKSQHIVLWAKKKDREGLKKCMTQLMENQIKKLKEQCLESF